ncbi:uncharacterized protein LOC107043019 [Diachasma alloeum]|uniref:uncharacterized protein LOC107043019 n=1 Tax=Diachasma alloeum TaxID=454923 RepID=UPI0007383C8A|nr:uncharacterized protein LOC107043019 [Diachasma alloeum]
MTHLKRAILPTNPSSLFNVYSSKYGTGRLLEDLGYIDREILLKSEPKLGQILVQKKGKHNVFLVIVKRTQYDRVKPSELKLCLHNLHYALEVHQVTSLCMAETDNELKGIENLHLYLKKEFNGSDIVLTLCRGNIQMPEPALRPEIIKENHDSLIAGHKGVIKTYLQIRDRFYWPGMKADIENFIRKCKICHLAKLRPIKTKQSMQVTDTPTSYFEKISMDIVGPLSRTPSGNMYILTIQDNFSKHCTAATNFYLLCPKDFSGGKILSF